MRTQVRQIVLNLVINASDAVGEADGRIAVRTGSMHCGQEQLASCVSAMPDRSPEGAYVFVEVDDDGCGMDEPTLSRIFDPFFTTKFTGRGLGLAATLGIVRGHHGTIQVRSEPGKGTAFRVLFPAVATPAAVGAKKPQALARRFSGAILLADDEKLVRRVAERQLHSIGFEVLVAADGLEAIDVFGAERRLRPARAPRRDHAPPRWRAGGRAALGAAPRPADHLLQRVREDEALSRITKGSRYAFLPKPFTYAELEQRLIDALGD